MNGFRLEDAYRPAEAPEQPNSSLPMMKFNGKSAADRRKYFEIKRTVKRRDFCRVGNNSRERDTCKNQIRALESARERTGSVARLVMFFCLFPHCPSGGRRRRSTAAAAVSLASTERQLLRLHGNLSWTKYRNSHWSSFIM